MLETHNFRLYFLQFKFMNVSQYFGKVKVFRLCDSWSTVNELGFCVWIWATMGIIGFYSYNISIIAQILNENWTSMNNVR